MRIGSHRFDHASYDARGDVLYLHVGERQAARDAIGTPEGHLARYGHGDVVIGVTIINARWLLDRDGEITITLPGDGPVRVEADVLAPALASRQPDLERHSGTREYGDQALQPRRAR